MEDVPSAYDDMISRTSTSWAPWHVIPADHKWFTRLTVAATIIDALESLNLRYPKVDARRRRRAREGPPGARARVRPRPYAFG